MKNWGSALFPLTLLLTLVVFWIGNKKVYYEQ